jgi:hypothetical protein
MARKLDVGDKVICQYFNKADGRFYGKTFTATIIEKSQGEPNYNPPRDYVVQREDDKTYITIWRKEIIKRIYCAIPVYEPLTNN